MKTIFSLTLWLTASIFSFAQEAPRQLQSLKTNLIAVEFIGSPGWPLGITYSQMISERLSIELGTGIFATGVGVNYYLTNPQKRSLNVYTGLSTMINYDGFPMVYIPVGVSYLGKSNFQYNLDVGLLASENVKPLPSLWFGVKVGYRFGADLEQQRNMEKTSKKNAISIALGMNDPIIGVIYERLITPWWSVEGGIGLIGLSVGTKYYISALANQKLRFHVGVSESWGVMLLVGSNGLRTYIPIGLTYLTKQNLKFSVDAGPLLWHAENNDITPCISFRVGKAF